MRVLYTAFDVVPSPKGASRHITYFTRALVEAGHAVTLFSAGLPDLPAAETYAGARILRYRSREQNFLRGALCFGDAVWEHLREAGSTYDVVHFRDVWSGTAALEARRHFGYRYRTLFEVNGLPSVELKYHYPALSSTAEGFLPTLPASDLVSKLKTQEQAALKEAEAVVCVSRVTALYLESLGVPACKVSVIPNGVDPAMFQPGDGPAPGAPRLVYTGTMAAWQGVHTLIQAMPVLLAAFPEAELHLLGPAKSRQQRGLLKLAAKLGLDEESVHFLGDVPPEAVPAQLQAAALCLAPLTYNDRNVVQGCCPIKVLEYAAAARPILAADLPVVRELLGEGEALFFQPGDASDLARQAIYLLSHPQPAQAMAERAARRVRQFFTWKCAGERLLEGYARLSE